MNRIPLKFTYNVLLMTDSKSLYTSECYLICPDKTCVCRLLSSGPLYPQAMDIPSPSDGTHAADKPSQEEHRIRRTVVRRPPRERYALHRQRPRRDRHAREIHRAIRPTRNPLIPPTGIPPTHVSDRTEPELQLSEDRMPQARELHGMRGVPQGRGEEDPVLPQVHGLTVRRAISRTPPR